jgi:hypothetical protein
LNVPCPAGATADKERRRCGIPGFHGQQLPTNPHSSKLPSAGSNRAILIPTRRTPMFELGVILVFCSLIVAFSLALVYLPVK